MKKISIVVPCYNEEKMISLFYNETVSNLKCLEIKYEIVFIDDGSNDKTLEKIKSINDKNVHYISFSRNFGKEAAILAGLSKASGDYVAVMDVDLQDPPSLLKEMYYIINFGYDIVATRRVTRTGEPKIRNFFATMFYKIISKMSDIEMVDGARDFRLMKREVIDAILSLKEYNRYSKGIFSFVGFKTKWLEYENINRVAGTTKWNYTKLFKYAIEGIVAFSNILLLIPIYISIVSFILTFILFIIMIFNYTNVFLIINIMLLFFSTLSFMIGVIGLYMSKVITEVRNRPIYIIKEEK